MNCEPVKGTKRYKSKIVILVPSHTVLQTTTSISVINPVTMEICTRQPLYTTHCYSGEEMKDKGKSMMYLLQLVRSRSPKPLFSSVFCKKNGDTLIEQLLQYFCGRICFCTHIFSPNPLFRAPCIITTAPRCEIYNYATKGLVHTYL